jgi:hypothetical protein
VFVLPLQAKTLDPTKPYVLSAVSSDDSNPNALGLENEIRITVVNGGELVREARQANKNIILFFDRIPLKEVYPEAYAIDSDKDELHFFIPHSGTSIQLWDHFIASRNKGTFFTRKVSVSVGIEDQDPVPTMVAKEKALSLVLVKKSWFVISIVLILSLLALFLVLAVRSDILRNVGPAPESGRRSYSLALVQMAIWFFVIMSSWLLLYVVKHNFNNISETLVLLMGISAGTGIGGVVIETARTKPALPSQGLLKDILSDDNGVSFHRFQIFAWTIVLVAVFVRQVTTYLIMPEFDSSLLILMGISSGTYLGFKATVKPGQDQAAKTETEPA